MATVSKANRPRKQPLLTRNGRIRIKPLSLTQLTELMNKTSSLKGKDKIRSRLNVLLKRAKKVA
jgi:hypothetical protein